MNRAQELFNKLDNIFKSNNLIVSLSDKNYNEEPDTNTILNLYLSILFSLTQEVSGDDIESDIEYDKREQSIEWVNNKLQTYNRLLEVLKENKIIFNANLNGFWIEKELLEYEISVQIDNEIYVSVDKHVYVDIYPRHRYYDCPMVIINDCLEFSYHIYDTKEFIKLEETEQDINSIPIKQTITKYYKPIN